MLFESHDLCRKMQLQFEVNIFHPNTSFIVFCRFSNIYQGWRIQTFAQSIDLCPLLVSSSHIFSLGLRCPWQKICFLSCVSSALVLDRSPFKRINDKTFSVYWQHFSIQRSQIACWTGQVFSAAKHHQTMTLVLLLV